MGCGDRFVQTVLINNCQIQKSPVNLTRLGVFANEADYLFITYIVTSKPKRISVAAGVVHIIILLELNLEPTTCLVRMYALCADIKNKPYCCS